MNKNKQECRVMFIQPPLSSDVRIKIPNHQIPLGFMYMAGLLEKDAFKVKILDCPLYYNLRKKIDKNTVKIGLFSEQIEREIRDFQPDIVGVNCSFTMFEQDSFEIIDLVKKINNKIIVVVGGSHASSNTNHVMRNKNIDLAVVGEGELTMLEIAQKFRDKKRLDNINGTALIKSGKLIINKPRELIQNLDTLEPSWHLLDFKKYFEHPDNYQVTMRSPSVNIVTSRGCPGNCKFCSVHTVWGRKWRAMSPEKVLSQIELLYKKYGIRHFRFNDDNMTLDKKRILKICRGIISKKLDIRWDTPSGVAMWTLDEEVLTAMKNSGYYRISLGIESGCENTLKYIGKAVDLEKANRLINYCHKIRLWVASFFIIGFPYEGPEEIKETVSFIINSKINFPFIFVAQPYPGTEMYQDFLKEGLLERGFKETSTFVHTRYKSKYFSASQLNLIRAGTYKKFYLKKAVRYFNPILFYQEFLSKIRNFEDLRYVIKIIKNLMTAFFY